VCECVDDPSDITQIVSTVTRDVHIQLFAEQLDLYHRHGVDKWKICPKSLKWTDITNIEMEKILRSDNFDEPSQKRLCKTQLVYKYYNSYTSITPLNIIKLSVC
jgi:hypothetical protein